jgi:hypothetical protein
MIGTAKAARAVRKPIWMKDIVGFRVQGSGFSTRNPEFS